MASELNSGLLLTSGLTDVVATPCLLGVAGTPIACTEIGATKMYHGDMAGAAGTYIIKFTSASSLSDVSDGEIVWDGTQEVTAGVPTAAENATATWADVTGNKVSNYLLGKYSLSEVTGVQTIRDASDNVLLTSTAYSDSAWTVRYNGTAAIHSSTRWV